VTSVEQNVCPFCGSEIHPGDQKCIACGNAIPNVKFSLNDLQGKQPIKKPKSKIVFILLFVVGVVFLLVFYFLLG